MREIRKYVTAAILPNTEGKLYRYTMKVYDGAGQFKDVNFYPLFTSFPDYHAGVTFVKDKVVRKNEPLHLVIHNWGPNYLAVNEAFRLFEKKNGEPKKIKTRLDEDGWMEPAIGTILTARSMPGLQINGDSPLIPADTSSTQMLKGYTERSGEFLLEVEVGSGQNRHVLYASFSVR